MKREMHLGDPCVFCDQAWDQITPGECPGRPGLEESADLRASIWALQDRYLRLYRQMEAKVAAAVAAEREAIIAICMEAGDTALANKCGEIAGAIYVTVARIRARTEEKTE